MNGFPEDIYTNPQWAMEFLARFSQVHIYVRKFNKNGLKTIKCCHIEYPQLYCSEMFSVDITSYTQFKIINNKFREYCKIIYIKKKMKKCPPYLHCYEQEKTDFSMN